MFAAGVTVGLIGFGLRHRPQEFLAQPSDLLDHPRFDFVQQATVGEEFIAQIGNLVQALTHYRILGKAFVQTLLR